MNVSLFLEGQGCIIQNKEPGLFHPREFSAPQVAMSRSVFELVLKFCMHFLNLCSLKGEFLLIVLLGNI